MKSVVVTGASSGIGWGCVKLLIAGGCHVFGSVRTRVDADRLLPEFGANFTPLIFDVTDAAAVAAGAAQVAAALDGETLFGLVNNAGIAVPGPLLYLKISDFHHQMAVNLAGQLIVTQAFLPLLGTDRSRAGAPGRIVMISSVGGKNAMPFLGPYNAAKFGLEGLSESLRRELMLFGIDVVIVAPGAVATPIWDKADAQDIAPFADTPYASALEKVKQYMIAQGRKGLPPERLGQAVKTALTLRGRGRATQSRPRRCRIGS
jgi:NAD(P)-dependent dehydrogenase (short-subunit alcohol dehydrogenase family)